MPVFYRIRTIPSVLLMLVFLLPSCRQPQEDEAEIIVTSPPEFVVDLFERRDAVDGHAEFGLLVESVATYDHANYALETAGQLADGAVEVRLIGVMAPDSGQGAPGPLRQFVPIGPLAEGEYPFMLMVGSAFSNEGRLKFAQGQYELSIDHPQGVDFRNRVLRSIPEGLIWGFVRTPDETSVPPALDFLQALKPLSAEPGIEPGFYSYFTLAGTGQISFHPSFGAGEPQAQTFVRRLTGSRAELQALLQAYRSQPNQPLEIRCWTTEGEL